MRLWLLVGAFLSLLGGLFLEPRAAACSSCGSGGADPLVLNPSEGRKVYLGLSHQWAFRDLTAAGEERSSYGPASKSILELAFAQRISSSLFGSAVVDYVSNRREGETKNGWGDASLNLRYTALQPSMLESSLPQVQLLVNHRFAVGRSIHDAQQDHYLDVFGAGFAETAAGVDLWWGMLPMVGGASFIYSVPYEKSTEAGAIHVGRMQKLILTTGFMPEPEIKFLFGLVAERRSGTELDGALQPDSDRRSQDLFFTIETLRPEADNLRFILSRKGALGDAKNTSRFWSATLAWMRPL